MRLERKIEGVPVQKRLIKVKFEDEQPKWNFVKRFNYILRDKGIYCKLEESQPVLTASRNKAAQVRKW